MVKIIIDFDKVVNKELIKAFKRNINVQTSNMLTNNGYLDGHHLFDVKIEES
ncbi:hypothetical protein LCGC14_0854950 [marine sediment metagenome]|uniref:Uncharacterized protein n=1 Tax=marine sediment metagenome TaxID=412755 RepID=A0A0F9PE09_9ZZZZ